MRVLYINNDGAGFADYVQVSEGTTVEQFFQDNMQGRKSSDYLIRVNRQPVPRDCVLQENDRVTITPVKIDGASALLLNPGKLEHHSYTTGSQRQKGAAIERADCSMIYRIQYRKFSSLQKPRRKRLPNCRYWLKN